MAASATFALKAGVWFRRGRLLMVSPDSRGTACPPSDRNSTYRPVQISGTGSVYELEHFVSGSADGIVLVGSANGNPATVPAVPLPAALPLFATGLGALGLIGWRRKRKAAAVAA
jgi:hypothetical protein